MGEKVIYSVVLSSIGAIPCVVYQVARTTDTVEESECCDGIIPGAVGIHSGGTSLSI